MTQLDTLLRAADRLAPRRTLRDEAADRLRDLILTGTLPPGTPVPERELSAALGISRTPLKEALRALEPEGLVTYSLSGRPSVSDPDAATLAQAMSVLATLECAAAEELVDTGADLSRVVGAQTALAALPADADPAEADMAFHAALVATTGNRILIDTHHRLALLTWRARAAALDKRKARKAMLRDHDAILAALDAGTAKPLRRAIRDHLIPA